MQSAVVGYNKASASSQLDILRVIALYRSFRPALRQSLKELSDTLFSLSYSKYIKLVQRLNYYSRCLPIQNPLVQKLAQKPIIAYKPIDVNLQIYTTSLIPTPQSRNQLRALPSFRSRLPSAALSQLRSRLSSTKRRSHYLRNGFCLYYSLRDYQIAQYLYSYSNS